MIEKIKAWWPVVSIVLDIIFLFVVLYFMITAMVKGKWDEAIFWLLMKATLSIKDKT